MHTVVFSVYGRPDVERGVSLKDPFEALQVGKLLSHVIVNELHWEEHSIETCNVRYAKFFDKGCVIVT